MAAVEYIHENPVKRKLCKSIDQWKWSSARFYSSDGQTIDEDLPTITKLPPELFD
jgi:putative transposase